MAKKGKWSGQAKRFVKRYNSYRRNFNKRVNKMIDQGRSEERRVGKEGD